MSKITFPFSTASMASLASCSAIFLVKHFLVRLHLLHHQRYCPLATTFVQAVAHFRDESIQLPGDHPLVDLLVRTLEVRPSVLRELLRHLHLHRRTPITAALRWPTHYSTQSGLMVEVDMWVADTKTMWPAPGITPNMLSTYTC